MVLMLVSQILRLVQIYQSQLVTAQPQLSQIQPKHILHLVPQGIPSVVTAHAKNHQTHVQSLPAQLHSLIFVLMVLVQRTNHNALPLLVVLMTYQSVVAVLVLVLHHYLSAHVQTAQMVLLLVVMVLVHLSHHNA